MTMMRGQLLQVTLTRARRLTKATKQLRQWSGAVEAMAIVASTVTAWGSI